MKSAAIVAAALALSATVMPAEPLPVGKPSGPSQDGARGDEQRHVCVELHRSSAPLATPPLCTT